MQMKLAGKSQFTACGMVSVATRNDSVCRTDNDWKSWWTGYFWV